MFNVNTNFNLGIWMNPCRFLLLRVFDDEKFSNSNIRSCSGFPSIRPSHIGSYLQPFFCPLSFCLFFSPQYASSAKVMRICGPSLVRPASCLQWIMFTDTLSSWASCFLVELVQRSLMETVSWFGSRSGKSRELVSRPLIKWAPSYFLGTKSALGLKSHLEGTSRAETTGTTTEEEEQGEGK